MNASLSRLVPIRLLSQIHFAFGGALIGGGAGIVLAAVSLFVAPHHVLTHPAFIDPYRRIATGAGVGWVGGLFWCALLILYARRHQPSPPSSALMRATWIAAGSSVVTDVAALYAGLAEGWAMTVALVAATLAARVWVTAAARRGA
jgi:hypothetical protein